MSIRKLMISFSFLILLPIAGFASDSFSFSGYYKSFYTAIDLKDFSGESDPLLTGAVTNRLRFKVLYNPKKWISLSSAYSPYSQIQDKSLFSNPLEILFTNGTKYRVRDLNSRIYPDKNNTIGNFGIYNNLDRALVTISIPKADIRIGRQAISWGSAHIINPTDIITPFSLGTLDVEERMGVDAVQIIIPVGSLGEFDLGSVWGEDFKINESAFFSRLKYNMLKSDVSILLLDFYENLLIGFDLARNIGGAGVWIEAAQVLAGQFQDKKTDEMKSYFRISLGMDYNLLGKIYTFAEYHYNGAGSTDPKEYLKNLSQTAYMDGSDYFMGKHYIGVGLNYQVKPLITLSGQSLTNLTDPSTFLSIQAEYNIAQNIYVSVGTFAGIGKRIGKTENISLTDIKPNSEFGMYQNTYFTSFRIYF